jgi:hypothetical protein
MNHINFNQNYPLPNVRFLYQYSELSDIFYFFLACYVQFEGNLLSHFVVYLDLMCRFTLTIFF